MCRRCDLVECQSQSPLFLVLYGCGHSYHQECLYRESCQGACSICAKNLKVQMEILAAKANDAIFNPSTTVNDDDDDLDDDDDDNNLPQVPQLKQHYKMNCKICYHLSVSDHVHKHD